MAGSIDLGSMFVTYRAKTEDLIKGMNLSKESMSSADKVAQSTGKNIASSFSQAGQSISDFAGKTITGIDTAKAKIVLLESEVNKARNNIKKIEGAADAGKAVTGLEEARAKLTLLEWEAQKARGVLQKLEQQEQATGQEAQELASKADKASISIGSRLAGSLRGASGGFLDFASKASMAGQGLIGLYHSAVSFGSALISPNAAMEQTSTAFTTLLHSGEAAKKMMDDLWSFASATPFEFPDIANSARHMLAFGFSAESILPMLNSVGDAVSALGGGAFEIDRVTTALGQMKAKTKVSAEEMLQLTEVGIPAWDLLSKGLGVTTAEAMKLSEKGLIPANKAVDVLVSGMGKAFGGGMQAQSKTFNGLLSTFKDNANSAWRSFTGPLFEQAKGGLILLGNLVTSPSFQQFAITMGDKVGGALLSVGSFISNDVLPPLLRIAPVAQSIGQWFVSNAGMAVEALKPLGASIGSALGGMADYLASDQFAGFLADVQTLGSQLNGILIPTFQDIGVSAGQAFNFIGPILTGTVIPAIDNLVFGLHQIIFYFQENKTAADVLGAALIGVGVAITAIKVGAFLATVPALIAGFIAWGIAAWGAAAGVIAATWPILAIGAAIALVVAGIVLAIKNWGAISKWLQDRWSDVSSFFGGVWDKIKGFFGTIGKWFQDRFEEAKKGIETAFGAIGKWFGDRWKEIQDAFGTVGKWFGDRFAEAWNGITSVFMVIGKWFGDRWTEIMDSTAPFREYMGSVFQTIWNIIVALWGKLGKWFGDRLEEVKAFLVPIGQWFHDRFSEAWNAVTGVFSAIGKWFSDRFTEAWNGITLIFGTIGQWFGDRWNEVTVILAVVGSWFRDRFTEAWDGITIIFGAIGQWFGDRWNEVVTVLSPVGSWFRDRFTEAWNGVTSFFGTIGTWFGDRWTDVMRGVTTFKDDIINKFEEVKSGVEWAFKGMINGVIDQLNNGIDAISSFINFIGSGLNNVARALGTQGTIPTDVSLGHIRRYASGTDYHPGGAAIVGEQGPELLFLPRGSMVAPNNVTQMFLSGGGAPGYAGGVGDWGGQIWTWLAGGAKSVVDNMIRTMGITMPNLAGMTDIATGIFNKVKDWSVVWVDKILPKFDFGTGEISENLKAWISSAMSLTRVPGSWGGPLATIAMHESGGNPNAINNSDINAQRGDPSRGLFQTIMATFMAYALPGYNTNIFDPIQNAAAAIRYIQARYGDVFHVPGIMALAAGRPYVGYANGGIIQEQIAGIGLHTGTRYAFGENGPEVVTPVGKQGSNAILLAVMEAIASTNGGNSSQGEVHIHNHITLDGREIGYAVEKFQMAELRHGGGIKR